MIAMCRSLVSPGAVELVSEAHKDLFQNCCGSECGFGIDHTKSIKETERGKLSGVTTDHLKAATCAIDRVIEQSQCPVRYDGPWRVPSRSRGSSADA